MTQHRAVVCHHLGLDDGVRLDTVARQPLHPGTIRVRMVAAGLNFPDLLMLQGLYQFKPPLPFVPGMEGAGVVAEATDTSHVRPGDRVFVMTKTGTFSEEMIVAETAARPLPPGFSLDEGAAFGVAAITAYHATSTRAALRPGQTVLVLGAAGGIGAATVQFAKALGARVIAAASSDAKLAFAHALGADATIDYRATVLEKEVARLTDGRGVDVIIDPVGWAPEGLTRSAAFGGKIMLVGFAGGTIPSYPANRLLLKGLSVIGVRAGGAGRNDKTLRDREWAAIDALCTTADLRPRISKRFALADFKSALAELSSRTAMGRVVLTSVLPGKV